MEKHELELMYAELLSDRFFDELSMKVKEPNIFKILKIENSKASHSNLLSWLLDPNESHGLNDLFLKRFLQDIFLDERSSDISVIDIGSLNLNNVEIRREWQNIDILVITDDFVVCLENKMWSTEHSNQLKRYRTIIETNFPSRKQLFVFLTPFGQDSSDSEYYINYSYTRIVEIIESIRDGRVHLLNQSVTTYLSDYLIILKQNVMNEDTANLWAKQLYQNHKELFDFVFDNKPDIAEEFRVYFENKVEDSGWLLGSRNKGYVRFLTDDLKKIIPIYNFSNGWPMRESFLFEIDFYWSKKNAILKTIISEGDEKVRDLLAKQISSVKGSIKPWGKKYLVHHTKKFPFAIEKMGSWDDSQINDEINKFWHHVIGLVNLVEAKILEKSDELRKMKSSYD